MKKRRRGGEEGEMSDEMEKWKDEEKQVEKREKQGGDEEE